MRRFLGKCYQESNKNNRRKNAGRTTLGSAFFYGEKHKIKTDIVKKNIQIDRI